MRMTRRTLSVTAGALLLLATAAPAGAQAPTDTTDATGAAPDRGVYEVTAGAADGQALARAGVDVLGSRGDTVTVVADPAQAQQLRAADVALNPVGDFDAMLAERNPEVADPKAAADEFPEGDEDYHTYDQLMTALETAAQDHPDITELSDVGTSHEGRTIPLMRIGAGSDTDKPEVLFTCNQHAREHLTTEMCLRIVERFTDGYGTDDTVTELVDTRQIYVIPTVNPDGSEYDISGGQYQGWRKNRQDQGTDLNRNWGYKWGCCGGSSGEPTSETYRGTEAFSAPETSAVRDFVNSRVVDGEQRIKAHIDFHTYGELVLWPFGHTTDDTGEGMTEEQAQRFRSVGEEMAGTNGYTPQQSSDLYVTDGDVTDWMWGQHKILSFTFEMYPGDGGGLDGFYPGDENIGPETQRNDEAVDILLREAGA
ncbi:M14 family metallopeptidase [Prauserella rugosa]|uniref:Zinc carboxypeptidase n=1 Tax=Prauserella rugosa TaxID=43354 RepID=A0A660C8G0_9PSEU|nr:M14 family metallopeptidase [Prauserella rugosa]KID28077.1 Zinc carboxypeptidase [Prauserella sp. Am3]KMS90378.1 carboxypeptidase [Streptomyces regensis]TWH19880.1 carboxypeptidase T [Prauserella rugosa]